MRSNIKPQNRRLLEALCYIDEEVLADVLADITVPEPSAPLLRKKAVIRSIKYAALLAACALLVGAVFPIVSYIMGIIDLNPGSVTISESTDSSNVIRTGYQVWGGEVYNARIGRLVRYLPATDEYEYFCDHQTCPEGCHFKGIECLSQIVDGKLYYIYDSVWGSDSDIRAAYLDLSTMKSVDIGDISAYSITGRAYVYDGYYYFSRKINLPRDRTELYRIPITGGSEELVLEFDGEGSLFMVADGEIITLNRYDYLLDPTPLVIKAYNIETGEERVLWSREGSEDKKRVLEPAFLDGKLYFLAHADEGNDLIRVDLESGEAECVQSGLSDCYWLMNNGVYYFQFESRTVEYQSMLSSIGDGLYRTTDSASLHYYDFDEKKESVVYKNEDIAPCYSSGMVIAGGKVCGYFCGAFPSLGLERAEVLISIDLSTGEIKALDEAEATDLPTGYDYVMTDEDLEQINKAWIVTHSLKNENFRRFNTVEIAMYRIPLLHYYFGKYGNTFVIYEQRTKRCSFSLQGYDFDFYEGRVWFIKDNKWYENANVPADLLTAEEAKAFHEAFTEHYLPLITYDYEILAFAPDIETLEEDEMKRVNEAYEKWYVEKRYESTKDYDKAYEYTYSSIGCHPHRFFRSSQFEDYHYYGKIGGKIFIATEKDTAIAFTTTEIAGYKFVLGGYDSLPLVYSDGVVTELSAAYETGLVSKQEVAKVHERHLAYYYYYFDGGRKEEPIPDELKIADNPENPSPIELTDAEKREIVWEYIENDNNLKYTFGVRCYGKFGGGAYAVMIDGPYMYTQMTDAENVAGYRFTFPNSQRMYIYKDGVFYRLAEAYARDIISQEDVAEIQWSKTPIAD